MKSNKLHITSVILFIGITTGWILLGQDGGKRGDKNEREKRAREQQRDRPQTDGDRDRPRREGGRERPHHEGDRDRPHHEGDRDRPHHEGDRGRPRGEGDREHAERAHHDDRVRHMMAAIEHLRAVGMHDLAEEVEKRAHGHHGERERPEHAREVHEHEHHEEGLGDLRREVE